MSATAPGTAGFTTAADDARAFLELTRLLNEVEVHHPELSAPLRLTLLRARREHEVMWLDLGRFRSVLGDLVAHAVN